jgi:hypothetical protein
VEIAGKLPHEGDILLAVAQENVGIPPSSLAHGSFLN